MNIRFSDSAKKDFKDLPDDIKARARKQLNLLQADLRHPSIRAKKYDESNDVWQGRVNRSYRFYFKIEEDDYVILAIIPHPK
jgi:mRNA-degrading endonuclease RelE of RelBE toxin-antitoxin system